MNGSPTILSTLSPRAEAEANQRAASNPAVSAFVAASAGSGKTRLLTDRLLRLMAGGARPERILCLTFTKAAATEMAVRLQRRLGEWVTLDAPMLESRLRDLAIEPTEATMVRARSLFAEVLDLPGGMRIGTIHGFCQSLLRRAARVAGRAVADRSFGVAYYRRRAAGDAPGRIADHRREWAGVVARWPVRVRDLGAAR